MNIIISDCRKIKDILDIFHEKFPFLKIEFFSKSHEVSSISGKNYQLDHDRKVGECRDIHLDGMIQATDKVKVWELEQQFQKYGLPAQVFRLMGNSWIETVQTDWWTLKQQNEHAREYNLELGNEPKYLQNEEVEMYNL